MKLPVAEGGEKSTSVKGRHVERFGLLAMIST